MSDFFAQLAQAEDAGVAMTMPTPENSFFSKLAAEEDRFTEESQQAQADAKAAFESYRKQTSAFDDLRRQGVTAKDAAEAIGLDGDVANDLEYSRGQREQAAKLKSIREMYVNPTTGEMDTFGHAQAGLDRGLLALRSLSRNLRAWWSEAPSEQAGADTRFLSRLGETKARYHGNRGELMQTLDDMDAALAAQPGKEPTAIQRIVGGIAQNVPSMLLGIGTAGVGTIAAQVGQATDRAAWEADKAGLTGGKRAAYIATQGTIEAAVTIAFQMAGAGGMEKAFTKQGLKEVAEQGFTQALKSLGKETMHELTEEELITVGQAISDKLYGVKPDMSLSDVAQQVEDTALVTLGMMGATRGTQHVVNGVTKRLSKEGQRDFAAGQQSVAAPSDVVHRDVQRSTSEQLDASIEQAEAAAKPIADSEVDKLLTTLDKAVGKLVKAKPKGELIGTLTEEGRAKQGGAFPRPGTQSEGQPVPRAMTEAEVLAMFEAAGAPASLTESMMENLDLDAAAWPKDDAGSPRAAADLNPQELSDAAQAMQDGSPLKAATQALAAAKEQQRVNTYAEDRSNELRREWLRNPWAAIRWALTTPATAEALADTRGHATDFSDAGLPTLAGVPGAAGSRADFLHRIKTLLGLPTEHRDILRQFLEGYQPATTQFEASERWQVLPQDVPPEQLAGAEFFQSPWGTLVRKPAPTDPELPVTPRHDVAPTPTMAKLTAEEEPVREKKDGKRALDAIKQAELSALPGIETLEAAPEKDATSAAPSGDATSSKQPAQPTSTTPKSPAVSHAQVLAFAALGDTGMLDIRRTMPDGKVLTSFDSAAWLSTEWTDADLAASQVSVAGDGALHIDEPNGTRWEVSHRPRKPTLTETEIKRVDPLIPKGDQYIQGKEAFSKFGELLTSDKQPMTIDVDGPIGRITKVDMRTQQVVEKTPGQWSESDRSFLTDMQALLDDGHGQAVFDGQALFVTDNRINTTWRIQPGVLPPAKQGLKGQTIQQLRTLAKELGVERSTKLPKAALIEEIEKAQLVTESPYPKVERPARGDQFTDADLPSPDMLAADVLWGSGKTLYLANLREEFTDQYSSGDPIQVRADSPEQAAYLISPLLEAPPEAIEAIPETTRSAEIRMARKIRDEEAAEPQVNNQGPVAKFLAEESGAVNVTVLRERADDLRVWFDKMFKGDRGTPKGTQKRFLDRMAQAAAAVEEIRQTNADLAAYKKSVGNWTESDNELLLRAARGDAQVMATLPEDLRSIARSFREQQDTISRALDKLGILDSPSGSLITKNLGSYIHRSYAAFDDPTANAARVRADEHLMARLASHFRKKFPTYNEGQIANVIEDFLVKPMEEARLAVDASAPLGKMPKKPLLERQELPQVLRQALGEYTDPSYVFARSIQQTSTLLARHQFLSEQRALGLGRWLFEEGDPNRPLGHNHRIAADENMTMSPIAGLYTTKEIADGFYSFSPDKIGPLSSVYVAATGFARLGKTVLSPVSLARNVHGVMNAMLIHGVNPIGEASGKAMKAMATALAPGYEGGRDYLNKMIELRVVAPGGGAETAAIADVAASWSDGGIAGVGKYLLTKGSEVYGAPDNFSRIAVWATNRDRIEAAYKKAGRAISDTELDQRAADVVHKTMPDYASLPKAVQYAARWTDFPRWAWETGRTVMGIGTQIATELRDPVMRDIGVKRLMGAAASAALFEETLRNVLQFAFDSDDDELEAARQLVHERDRRGFLMPIGRDSDGHLKVINTSNSNVHGPLRDVVYALARGEDWQGVLGDWLFKGFLKPDMAHTAFMEAYMNRDDQGRQIANPEAPDQLWKRFLHFSKAWVPGAASSGWKIGVALYEGDTEKAQREAFAQATGLREIVVDPKKALDHKSMDFDGRRRDLSGYFNAAVRDGRPTGQLVEAYAESNARLAGAQLDMARAIRAARVLGMGEDQIKATLRQHRLDKDTIEAVTRGETFQMEIGSDDFDRILAASPDKSIAQQKIAALYQAELNASKELTSGKAALVKRLTKISQSRLPGFNLAQYGTREQWLKERAKVQQKRQTAAELLRGLRT